MTLVIFGFGDGDGDGVGVEVGVGDSEALGEIEIIGEGVADIVLTGVEITVGVGVETIFSSFLLEIKTIPTIATTATRAITGNLWGRGVEGLLRICARNTSSWRFSHAGSWMSLFFNFSNILRF